MKCRNVDVAPLKKVVPKLHTLKNEPEMIITSVYNYKRPTTGYES